ncbi:ATP-dependent helicase, partial [Bacillus altitudinis]|nr:ATP-dependent helicase [Bacillus altitudinis]
IQFDLLEDVSAYVHRSGRTGRLGSNAGTVVSLVTPGEEKVLKKFAKAQHVELGRKDIKRGELVDPE